MSVRRYRDVAAMPPPAPSAPGVAATYARIRDAWRFANRLVTQPLYRPGVYRYRSIEDSEVARDRATIERMRTMRAARERR